MTRSRSAGIGSILPVNKNGKRKTELHSITIESLDSFVPYLGPEEPIRYKNIICTHFLDTFIKTP